MSNSFHNLEQIVKQYKNKHCKKLLYTNPDNIRICTKFLQDKFHDTFNQDNLQIASKTNFNFPTNNTNRKFFPAKTSGTTSGQPFHYKIDAAFYQFVEFDCRYYEIIRERNICCQNILFLLKTNLQDAKIIKFNKRPTIASHGTKLTKTHYLTWSDDINETIATVVQYLQNNKIDVVLADGSIINILTSYIKKHNIKSKICTLLSNTNEKLIKDDAEYLLKNQNIDFWCDHMRCWDGGAAFMTCPYYTYHLLENLSYVQTVDGQMISTDYFNLIFPFVNYWNGDYCTLEHEYKLCRCGRWYRSFQLTEPRVWSIHGITSDEIKNKIRSLKIKGIQQVRCDDRYITIISDNNINDEYKQTIKDTLPQFTVYFTNN